MDAAARRCDAVTMLSLWMGIQLLHARRRNSPPIIRWRLRFVSDGKHIGRPTHPSPLPVTDYVGDTPKSQLLREILVLTKMNWNSANFAGLLPITLRFSRLVGETLREVLADRTPNPKYKFYM